MLVSHCLLRERRHLPFLWVTGTSCSSTDLLTWTIFNNSLLIQSSSRLKALWRTEKCDVISCPCYSLPETHTGCWGGLALVCEQEEREHRRWQVWGSQADKDSPAYSGGCSETVVLHSQKRPYSIHQSSTKKLPRLEKPQKTCKVIVSSTIKYQLHT